MYEVMLSIIVPTYNHEKYIAQALNSILMQETQYTFEVLVGEDASPDGTRAVLQEYEKKYPDFFTMFYRDQNMYSLGHSNSLDLRLKAKGKYLITLEGDDYWTDKHKIEEQVRFLEENPRYLAVAHNCVVVDENSNITDERYPECHDLEYSISHFSQNILPGQTATFMYRNFYLNPICDTSIIGKGTPGDRLLYFSLISHGPIYCIQKVMSAYRHVTNGGSSFSATYKYEFKEADCWHMLLLDYAYRIRKNHSIKCAELLYMRHLVGALRRGAIGLNELLTYMKKIKNLSRTILLYSKYLAEVLCKKLFSRGVH